MDSRPILVLYGSSHGQTAKIARYIGERLQHRGLAVEVLDAREVGDSLTPDRYAGILVGASLIARGIQPPVRRFVERNAAALNRGLSAFYQVSASAGSAHQAGRDAATERLAAFLKKTGWTPDLKASVAGAVKYTRYGLLLRWYMKRASAHHGGATDTSRDHEYTDWRQVDRFADDFAALIGSGAVAPPGSERSAVSLT